METLQLRHSSRAIAVCKAWDVPLGLGRAFTIDGRHIAIFRTREGEYFAVDGLCPHKGGTMADGMIVGRQVVCPMHAFRFEAGTGACDQPGVCAIGAYPVSLVGDTVVVTFPNMDGPGR